jgi:predicted transcriptional regulator
VGDYQDTDSFAAQQRRDVAFKTLLPHLPLQKFKKCAPAQSFSISLCAANFISKRKQVDRQLATLAKIAEPSFLAGMDHAGARGRVNPGFGRFDKISRVSGQKYFLVRHSSLPAFIELNGPSLVG